MSAAYAFAKYESGGQDVIVVRLVMPASASCAVRLAAKQGIIQASPDQADWVRRLCHRGRGIGADMMVLIVQNAAPACSVAATSGARPGAILGMTIWDAAGLELLRFSPCRVAALAPSAAAAPDPSGPAQAQAQAQAQALALAAAGCETGWAVASGRPAISMPAALPQIAPAAGALPPAPPRLVCRGILGDSLQPEVEDGTDRISGSTGSAPAGARRP